MAVLGKAFKASCVDVLLPRELATGQHLLGQHLRAIGMYLFSRRGHRTRPEGARSHSPHCAECDALLIALQLQGAREKSYTPVRVTSRSTAPTVRELEENSSRRAHEGARHGSGVGHARHALLYHGSPARARLDERVTTPCVTAAARDMVEVHLPRVCM